MIPRNTPSTRGSAPAAAPSTSGGHQVSVAHIARTAPATPELLEPLRRAPSDDASLPPRQALPTSAADRRNIIEQENAALAEMNDELERMFPMNRGELHEVEAEAVAVTELNEQLQRMWPSRDATPTPHEMADERDDLPIRQHYDSELVAKARHGKLNTQVERASTQADVDALTRTGERIRQRASTRLEVDARATFSEELAPTPQNIRSMFRPLTDLARQFSDAAEMWESAADHFGAALQAARTIEAPEAVIASLQESATHCEITASRLAIKRDVARGVHVVKHLRPEAPRSHQWIKDAEGFFDAALKRHRAYVDAATPQAPRIEGFDFALRDAASQAQSLRDTLPAVNQVAGSLHTVANELRAELHNGFAQAPLRRLNASLHPLMELAASRVKDAQALVTDAHWSKCAREVAAWNEAVIAYGKCVATFRAHAVSLSAEATQERAVTDLRAALGESCRQSLVGLRRATNAAYTRLFEACSERALDILATEETGDESLSPFVDMAAQCREIREQLRNSPALPPLRNMGAAPDHQLADFATLEAMCGVLSRPVHDASGALERVQEIMDIAQSMARRPQDPVGNENVRRLLEVRAQCMRVLLDTMCTKLLEMAVALQSLAALELYASASDDRSKALRRAEELLVLVACIPSSDALPDTTVNPVSQSDETSAAAQAPSMPAADQAMVEQQRQVAREAKLQRKHALKLPSDVRATVRSSHDTAMLVLRHVELSASTAAEIIDTYHRAVNELQAAAPARRRKVAQLHAEPLRRLSTSAGEALGEQISAVSQSEDERMATSLIGSQLRQAERISETMRLELESVGLLFEARHKAQDIRRRLSADNHPPRGSLSLIDADTALTAEYRPAVELMKANMLNISRDSKGAEGSTSTARDTSDMAFALLLWRAEFDRAVTSGKIVLDWFMARLATAKDSALDLDEFDSLAKNIKSLITTANITAIALFAERPQVKRACLEVTTKLLRDFQTVRSEIETRLQYAPSAPPLPEEATVPASSTEDTHASDVPAGTQRRQGERDAGSSSRGQGGTKKGGAGHARRRS